MYLMRHYIFTIAMYMSYKMLITYYDSLYTVSAGLSSPSHIKKNIMHILQYRYADL